MIRLTLALALITIVTSAAAFAGNAPAPTLEAITPSPGRCKTLQSDPSATTPIQEARSGCCSWHGGVCGCSGSRTVCCDGSLSPSCGC